MKLHAGCGPRYIDGWFNVDLRKDVKTDYCGNILDLVYPENKFFIPDDSVDMIWACHFLEHLDYPDGVVLCLTTFYDWLKSGGRIRLAVPDLELVAGYYLNKDLKLFQLFPEKWRYYKFDSAAERFMFFARGWEHTILFDFDLIKSLLEDAKFKNIERCKFGESRTGVWNYDKLKLESLYVEGEK